MEDEEEENRAEECASEEIEGEMEEYGKREVKEGRVG